MLDIIFRCCRVKSSSSKYAYLSKIMRHYESNFDVKKILTNQLKLLTVFDYTFNKREQEVIELYTTAYFFELCEVVNNEMLNRNEEDSITNSKIFRKLKIPRSLVH